MTRSKDKATLRFTIIGALGRDGRYHDAFDALSFVSKRNQIDHPDFSDGDERGLASSSGTYHPIYGTG